MAFCGHCGRPVTANNIRCYNCGAVIETDLAIEDLNPNDLTIASPSVFTPELAAYGTNQKGDLSTRNQQQPLVLRSDGDYNNGTQGSYEATRMAPLDPVMYTPRPELTANTRLSPPGLTQQPASTYQIGHNYAQQNTLNYPAQGTWQTDFAGRGYQPQAVGYQVPTAQQSDRGRIVGLIFILLGLLFILGATVLFFLQSSGYLHLGSNSHMASFVTLPIPFDQQQTIFS